jgi:hypothetical protein
VVGAAPEGCPPALTSPLDALDLAAKEPQRPRPRNPSDAAAATRTDAAASSASASAVALKGALVRPRTDIVQAVQIGSRKRLIQVKKGGQRLTQLCRERRRVLAINLQYRNLAV